MADGFAGLPHVTSQAMTCDTHAQSATLAVNKVDDGRVEHWLAMLVLWQGQPTRTMVWFLGF